MPDSTALLFFRGEKLSDISNFQHLCFEMVVTKLKRINLAEPVFKGINNSCYL
jgi:hypothetical protein